MLHLIMPRKKKQVAPDIENTVPETTSKPTVLTPELLERIHELALKQVAPHDIAKTLDLQDFVVYAAITEHFPHLKELKLFKDFKADIFRSLQKKATEWMLEKIPFANLKDLTYLVAILEDKINLLEGRTTQNIGIGIRIEHLVSQKEKLLAYLRNQGVPEYQLEVRLKELLSLPNSASIPLHELGLAPEQPTESPPLALVSCPDSSKSPS